MVLALAGAAPSAAQDPPPGPPVGLLPVPDPLPPGAPGDVIDSAAFPVAGFPYAVEAHQLLYRSTDRFGDPVAVSGTVVVPVGVPEPAAGRAAVAWAHGTVGLGDGCAPSVDAQEGWGVTDPDDGYDGVRRFLDAGHVVVATDYPGIGTPGLNPYLDGVGAGRSVLDSLRAARAFGATSTAVVSGFSQGGHASLYAGTEWGAGYAPDVDLVGVAPVAAPTFVSAAYGAAQAVPAASSYVGPILAGLVVSRPDLDPTDLLTPSGQAALAAFEQDDAEGECPYPSFDLDVDVRADPLSVPGWAEAARANDPPTSGIDVPVLLVAGEQDTTSLVPMTDHICTVLQQEGTDVRLWLYPQTDHVGTTYASWRDRSSWLLDRIAGAPVTDEVAFVAPPPEVITACPFLAPPPAQEPPAAKPPGHDDTVPPAAPPATPLPREARFTG